jgi:hypothetical protein
LYGKSFDELAEEELFGMKLSQEARRERYEVNIDEYIGREKQTEVKVEMQKK